MWELSILLPYSGWNFVGPFVSRVAFTRFPSTLICLGFFVQIVAFLRKKDDFVNLLLHHIGTSAIMDLLLRLLTCVEQSQLRQDVFNVRIQLQALLPIPLCFLGRANNIGFYTAFVILVSLSRNTITSFEMVLFPCSVEIYN